jgi:hypothetical protein
MPPIPRFWLVVFLALMAIPAIHAQLAITEVMPVTRTNMNTGFRGAEYWEITNFGTNATNLHNFGFRDSNPERSLVKYPFTNLVLQAGESVVIFRIQDSKQSVTNAAQFREWWGTNVPAHVQCRTWNNAPGLSGWDGDEVNLFDPAGKLVDRVQFARARLGRAFTYASESGLFGLFSASGVDGAFTAELADDIGSPGATAGPVPIHFLQQPADQVVDVSASATISAVAAGMPQPRYQWFSNNMPILNGTNATLSLLNVQPSAAGEYYLLASNALSLATSTVVMVTVNTNPSAPFIIAAPAAATVFPGQTARFSVSARGVPAPTYQWSVNGAVIPNAVGPQLLVGNASLPMSGTHYSVLVSNAFGSTNVGAVLTVIPRPDLRFTEVMALPSDGEDNQHFDWFELTNFGTNAVDLTGWRFSDEPSFAGAFTITNTLVVQSGECVVFAERLNLAFFRAWWGWESLPATLQVCEYSGFGLGAFGETLFLWNPAATDRFDYTSTLSWAAAIPGVSFICERQCAEGFGCVDEATAYSVAGEGGAFHAVEGGHVGSPGYLVNPSINILSIRSYGGSIVVSCRVTPGLSYRLQRSASPLMPTWTALPTQAATNNAVVFTDNPPANVPAWFYRLEQVP